MSTPPPLTTQRAKLLAPGLLLAVGAVLLSVYLATLATGLTWHNNGADGGDLATAASTLGIAHPTGYPTYLLVARLFQALPLGALAYRTNLLSALSAVLAAALTVIIVVNSYNGPRRFAWAGGLAAGLGFGLSPLLWSQAVITEVYALHTFFITLLTLWGVLVTVGEPSRRLWFIGAGGVVFGLALGNHLTTILLLPIWIFLIGWRQQKIQWQSLITFGSCLFVGVLVYLYIPLRASAHAPVNWGGASTWEGFWWLVTGRGYGKLAFGLPPNLIFNRISAWAGLTINQLSVPGFFLALYGLFFGRVKPVAPQSLTVWLFAAYSIFAMGYGTSDSSAYLLPAFLALAIWFGIGLATGLAQLSGRWQGLRPVALALSFVFLFANAVHQLPVLDASHDLAADEFGNAVMTQAPPNAVILTTGDRDTFALWFFHFALHQRTDIVLIDEPLWQFPWYRENLAYTYPDI